MKKTDLQLLICVFFFASMVFAQSQALNGQIEGTISDETGAVVPNVIITATNIETGAARTIKTDESGVYRFPLLSLGTYRITAEATNFKKFVREGIVLSTGQTATVDIRMQAGDIKEVVTVSADTSIADAGKTDLSRVINNRDVQNLPIPQRNPYNLGRLQTNVNGRTLLGFNNANLNVNGYLQRVNYLFDGNWSNLADRPGVRLLFVSETYVNEVQIVTNGFSAEFGNTPGMIMNLVTPSGTNNLRGSVGYRFARTPFYARPFFYSSPDDLPKSDFNNLTATVGNLRYDALSLQLTQRFSRGLQFSASYTFSKVTDDASDSRLEGLNLSDASNRRFDRALSTGDQRHTFIMSLVFRPQFNFANKTLRSIFNNNQFGIIANANSGERFNIVSTIDLNRDGFRFDRPVGIGRNAGKTPNQYNVDLRYSRFFKFTERYRLEFYSEFQNLFNINSIVGYSDVTVTNVNPNTGELIGELPNFEARNQSIAQESRQIQLGFKFIF